MRLVGGRHLGEGRVEVHVNDTWATICDEPWDIYDASVICEIMGYVGASEAHKESFFGQGSGPILQLDSSCAGQEVDIALCFYEVSTIHDCDHNNDAGVTCSNKTARLVGGRSPLEGTVELFHDNQWSTICGDDWDINDGHVVCGMLGYYAATFAFGNALFGEGRGNIVLDNVQCQGDEKRYLQLLSSRAMGSRLPTFK